MLNILILSMLLGAPAFGDTHQERLLDPSKRLGGGRNVVPLNENDLFFTQLHSYTLLPNGSFTSRMFQPGQALPPLRMFLHFDPRFSNEVNDGRRGRWTWVWTDQNGQLVLDEFGNPDIVDSGTIVTGEWLGIAGDQTGYELNPSGNRYWNRIGNIDQIQIVSWSDQGFFDNIGGQGLSDPAFLTSSRELEGVIDAPVGGLPGASGSQIEERQIRTLAIADRPRTTVFEPNPSSALCKT